MRRLVRAASADRSTLPETPERSEGSGGKAALALTILFHPLAERVGDRVALGPLLEPPVAPPWTARVSRTEPGLAPALGGPDHPLDEEHVSREPALFSQREDGSVELDATGTRTKVVSGGRRLDRRHFSRDELRRGVVLLFGGHVVLLLHEVALTSAPLDGRLDGLVGQSDGLCAVLRDIRSVADLKRPVLLRGGSGTGKELVARAIHRGSRRSEGPFVAVNLGAVPATIAASELFGAEKGAFTGALRRAGYFDQAHGGTLFLDEIGEAPAEMQAALLRAIQEGEIQPLGAARPRKVDVRVVAATDADLEAKVRDGSFRAPLLNRLAAYQIWIPRLADRKDDIGCLLAHFFEQELSEVAAEEGAAREGGSLVPPGWIPAPLVAQLCEHDWPGNVRQLRNVVHHLVIHGRHLPKVTMTPAARRLMGAVAGEEPPRVETGTSGRIDEAERPSPTRAGKGAPVPQRPSSELSETEIREALRQSRWEIDAAARLLGVARPSLYRAMGRFPTLRTAGDLSEPEIREAHSSFGGDVGQMASALEVSERALLRRVRELGLLQGG